MEAVIGLIVLMGALFWLIKRFLTFDQKAEQRHTAEYLGNYYERPRE